MTPPVKMPVLLSVGAQELHPFHVMSPASLVAFYLSHFQQLTKNQQATNQPVSPQTLSDNPLNPLLNQTLGQTPGQTTALGVIPLNWILNQELGHHDHQIHHQPVSYQEMMAHEWALLDRQLQGSPFGGQSNSDWPIKPSQSGEAGPSTDMVYRSNETEPIVNPFLLGNSAFQVNPFHQIHQEMNHQNGIQTPLQQVLSETIHQYIWNLMYPGLNRQKYNQTEEPSPKEVESGVDALDETVRKDKEDELLHEL